MNELLSFLLVVRNHAHVLHWKTRSFARHLALGELYDGISELVDELAEIHMGLSATTVSPQPFSHPLSDDPIEFITTLNSHLMSSAKVTEYHDGLKNKYDELLSLVAKTKYKLEKLS